MQPQITQRRHARPIHTSLLAILFALPLSLSARAASANAFAAPAQISAPSAGFGVMRMVLALLLVLAAVYAAAALLRRLRVLGPAGTAELQVISQVALGARERAVLLRAGGRQIVVGVAPGNVRLLWALDEPVPAPTLAPTPTPAPSPVSSDQIGAVGAVPHKPTFRDLLRRSLGQ
jgi:flagellar protein FliO/FliZ